MTSDIVKGILDHQIPVCNEHIFFCLSDALAVKLTKEVDNKKTNKYATFHQIKILKPLFSYPSHSPTQ